MKTDKHKKVFYSLLTVVLLCFTGMDAWAGQGGVRQIYKQANAPVNDARKIDGLAIPLENTVTVKTPYQGGLFRTETRKDKIERFKCSQCHNNQIVMGFRNTGFVLL